jgi:hypothetical protein
MGDSLPQGAAPDVWWRTISVAENGTMSFQIGPLQGWVQRSRLEWSLAHRYASDDDDDRSFLFQESASDGPPERSERSRFPFRQTAAELHFKPALADLPVVVRPEDELFLPPGEETRLFVSTPLWLVLAAGPREVTLVDMPIRLPSETWFGPSTREGEVCYAARSRAKLFLADLRVSGIRAITAVHVRNRGHNPFAINRIKVPAPQLSLLLSEDGRLWTETLSIERTVDAKTVALEIGTKAPPEVHRAVRIGQPRRVAERRDLFQSMGSFLRGR